MFLIQGGRRGIYFDNVSPIDGKARTPFPVILRPGSSVQDERRFRVCQVFTQAARAAASISVTVSKSHASLVM